MSKYFLRIIWNDLIALVEDNKVGAIIVKDMSRLGRDYLKVGFYTEVMFVEKNIRFIAINNGIDSVNQTDSDFTEDREGYLDLCAEEGFSGSPIFLNNSQIKLVGVLVQCVGKSKKPQSTTIYVSADKILDMIKKISKKIKFPLKHRTP